MNLLFKRSLALLLALVLCIGLLSGLAVSVSAATVNYVTGKPTGSSYSNVIKNWGKRGVTATFFSPNAESFYERNGVTYEELAALSGSSSVSSVPSSALYKSLQNLMKSNHHTLTSYGDVRYLMSYTDIQENGTGSTGNKISSIYSAVNVGPTWDYGDTWNREHVWPNSKGLGGSDEDDIMMLRPENPSVNSGRGNTAFGVSSGYQEPNGTAAYNVRGDVARILLYTYVRWGNTSRMWGSYGVIESKQVLLDWLEEDPVDTWEMGRNDSVESITGTRNVFVDYPELAYLVFGETVPNMITPSGEAHDLYPGTELPDVPEIPDVEVPEVSDPEADSVLTIAEAIALGSTKNHNAYTTGKYYVTGVITEVYNTTYGNMKIQDAEGNILTVYGTWSADGSTRYDALSVKPVAGDTVTVYGIIGQYNSVPQIKNGWITEHVPGEGGGEEVPDEPVVEPEADTALSIADAIDLGASKDHNTYTAGKYYVTGVITEVYNTTYGNMKIQDTEGNILTVYGTWSADGSTRYDKLEVKPVAGDTVTVYGVIGQYNNVPQIKNGWITEHVPGEGGGEEVPDEPVVPDPEEGTELTIAEAIALGETKAHNTYTENKYYISGEIVEIYNTQYGNMKVKDAEGNILTIYGTWSYDGATRFDAMEDKPEVGHYVFLYGVIGQYNGIAQMKNGWIQDYTNPDEEGGDCSGHVPAGEGEVTVPTCSQPGYITYTCSLCGLEYFEENAPADPEAHDYLQVGGDPACAPDAMAYYRCELCNHEYSEKIPTVPHVLVDGVCTVCGAAAPLDPEAFAATVPVLSAESEPVSGGGILTWEPVEGATYYKVYRATSKSGSYKLLETVEDTELSVSVSAGKTRYYKIKAVYDDDNETVITSKYSNYVKVKGVCAQPVATVYARASNGKPYIDWNKVSGAKKYYVYRVNEDGTMTRLTSTTKTYYTHTKAEVGVEYTYVVRAIASSSSRNSIYSEPVTCIAKLARPVLKIKLLSSSGKPELDWKNITGAVSYEVWRAAEDEAFTLLAEVTQSSFVDESAVVDVEYEYHIVAVAENDDANSVPSNDEDATAKCAKPVASAELVEKKPIISWGKVDGAVKYYVYRSTSKSGSYQKIATVDAEEGESYRDAKAKKNKTYYYKIVAVSEESKSSKSAYVKIKSK